jgi:pilus assembly protein CpaE
VLLFAEPNPRVWGKAVRAGIRDIIGPEQSADSVRTAIDRAIEVAQRRRANLTGERDPTSGSQVIVVLSPKGGAGKTIVSCNLAVGLAAAAPRDVVLFDTDLQFGDVSNALRLAPTGNFSDAVTAGLSDLTALKLALTSHHTGLYALCASDLPADADDITGEDVGKALSLLRDGFRYVVVDTDAGLGERTLATIEAATDLVFLCATDVPSVRGLRKELEALDTIGLTHQRRHFVLNRADAKVGLCVSDIQDTINHRIDVLLPSSRSVPLSMNQGIPLLEEDNASPTTRAMWELVGKFADRPAQPSAPAHRAGRRWRREG